ncbi:uncharacterized protein FIBRA_08209 [Fibroporia radiculosa]|uniref:Uncharacterized protein n=1 Tax=Fibroporia radiculosa TaxID=599839 RepID=J4GGT6_9APHY|nr:uncharacterized protein FIBRA_08209 [Fibroporia radiculosa]CCM05968.1 predicted protein [Fibroporia radiculosa]
MYGLYMESRGAKTQNTQSGRPGSQGTSALRWRKSVGGHVFGLRHFACRSPPQSQSLLQAGGTRAESTSGCRIYTAHPQMSAYYRDRLPSYTAITSGPELYGAIANNIQPDPSGIPVAGNSSQTDPIRRCSVKGCGVELRSDYALKMCEACRGRHRKYASTKRAKRKMEKAALGAQGDHQVVWMPSDPTADGTDEELSAIQTGEHEHVSSTLPESAARTYEYTPGTWDTNTIDPSLFSQDSELAGALTPVTKGRPHDLTHNGTSTSTPDTNEAGHPANVQSTSSNTSEAQASDLSLPPRFCSIKGCKALVSGTSFFKMCEPCRDRYRNYGTTKRAKWKREKEEAVSVLHRMRDEEDRRREQAGLPPISQSPTEWRDWPEDELSPVQSSSSVPDAASPNANVPLPPRMCTVSHCREILPGNYQYLRCERHRIQNRHHSKLKRVRDKEVKALAFDGWVAVAGTGIRATSELSGGESPSPSLQDTSMESMEQDCDDITGSTGLGVTVDGTIPADALSGIPCTGVPPAARGTRRTNHVCSIKACYNLLAPTNPWKMCDSCRARDRAGRRDKALRDSGLATTSASKAPKTPKLQKTPVLAEDVGETPGDGQGAAKLKKKKTTTTLTDQGDRVNSTSETTISEQVGGISSVGLPSSFVDNSHIAGVPPSDPDPTTFAGVPADLIFMEPLYQDPDSQNTPLGSSISPAQAVITPRQNAVSDPFQIVSTDEIAGRASQSEMAVPTSKKKAKRKKGLTTVQSITQSNVHSRTSISTDTISTNLSAAPAATPNHEQPNSSIATSQAVPSADASTENLSNGEAAPPSLPMAPQYLPYFMHSYGMTPYGAQPSPFSYSAYPYSRPPYPSGSTYQPTYAPYPQPYSFPHYGQPYAPQAFPPPPPPPPPTPQSMYTVSADFVSREEYSASQGVQGTSVDGTNPNTSPYYSTFSAKTGEPHHRTTVMFSLPKRKRDEQETLGASKRPVSAANQRLTAAASVALAGSTSGPLNKGSDVAQEIVSGVRQYAMYAM